MDRLIPSFLAGLAAALQPAWGDISSVAWQGTMEVASGRGEKGPWQQNQSRYDYVDDPTAAIGHRGDILVAWVDQGWKDVLLQRFSADGDGRLARATNVSRNPDTFSWLPRMAIAPGPTRDILVLWQEIIFSGGSHGGDILFARSRDGGATFSEPLNLSSNSPGGDGKGRITREIWHNGSLDLAAGPDGTIYAAWTEYHGNLWFSRSTDGGTSFSPPRRLAGSEAEPARGPSLAVGHHGTVYLAWTIGENDAADIRLARSDDGGMTFGEARIVAPSLGYSDAPKLAVDREGTVHLAYGESGGGPFDAHHIRYTRSRDRGLGFEPPRTVSMPDPAPFRSAAFPDIALDGQGNPVILWDLFQHPRSHPSAQAIVVSRDGGRTFSAPRVVPGSAAPPGAWNGSQQGLLMRKLAVGGSGSIVVANSVFKRDAGSSIRLMRGRLSPVQAP